ncbi:hypothetical protein LTS16_021144 [Friedmanniomyces endolithicus]|nr:hypothetical protein LTR59_000224 [Friedmanniomyces endolithicus]KAK0837637.1 hypothetical protein LTR03_012618 [Friedmanniomyces endolithicus]KAK1027801.1 hypothetical protein LTS16_021144 [Friedmanniomyces endolithicus]
MSKEANTDNETGQTPITHARDWNGTNDPGDPRNFTLLRRIYSTTAVTLLAFVTTFAASIYSPGSPEVARTFSVSDEVAILPLAFYNLGLAAGPLIGSPVSETSGRKVVLLITTPCFALFTLGAGFSKGITALVLFTKESYKKTILQRRAKKLGIEGPPQVQRTTTETIRYFATTLLFRPLHMLLTEPIVTLVCLYNAFLFGLIYTFVVAAPWIYKTYYGFSVSGQSLSFLGMITGTAIAPFPLILIDHFIYQPRLKRFRETKSEEERFPPEYRLYPALIASFILPAGLFAFAWTVRSDVPAIVPIVFQGLTALASLLIYASANLFMMDAYGPLYGKPHYIPARNVNASIADPPIGASAAGAAMLSRYTLSAAFPLFALKMYQALGVGWATSLLAFCTLAMAPIPWLFWKFGEDIRRKSRYETSA